MTSVATVSRPARVAAQGAYDRTFYSGIAWSMALLVLIGFGPTYYLRSYFGAPTTVSGSTELTLLTHIHGALFSAWVLLFIVQTTLIARRQTRVHQRLGIAGMVLASVMVVIGSSTAVAAAGRGLAPPGADAKTFLIVPLSDMALFAAFVAGAYVQRRNKETHKRLMLLAYISIITAAVARLPGLIGYGPLVFFGLSYLYILAGVIYDRATRGRVHPVYTWGGLVLVISVPLRLAVSGTAAWQAFAAWLVA